MKIKQNQYEKNSIIHLVLYYDNSEGIIKKYIYNLSIQVVQPVVTIQIYFKTLEII